ncbi:MAG: hypothetical protein AABX03_03010 [Nanoarchaeota archaeon]
MKPPSRDKKVIRKVTKIINEMFEYREYSPDGTRKQRGDPSVPIIPSEQKEYFRAGINFLCFVAENYSPPEEDEERENYKILYLID